MSKTGAIVVSYNSEHVLRTCLQSLKKNGFQDIVVVDNNSQDNSLDVANHEGVRFVRQSKNTGFASAINAGAQQLKNEFLLLLNPDAALVDNSFHDAEQFMVDHKDVGVLGMLLRDGQGQPELESFGTTVTLLSLFSRRFQSNPLPQKTRVVAWVSGGAMLVRRSVFEKVDGFDDQFFLYWEDVDFCHRVRQAGYTVMITPSVHVVHSRGASLDDSKKRAELYDISADRYFYKHYSKAIWLLHRQLKRSYRLFSRRAH